MPLKVCLIAGDNHTQHCGVKDYAHQLARALGDRGILAEVCAPSDWNVSTFLRFCRQLRSQRFDVVHVQYPSIGFRSSLFPHLLGFAGIAPAACVTLHEHTSLPLTQRLSTHLFRLSTQAILFTTEEERRSFTCPLGGFGAATRVIPIGSNVPVAPVSAERDSTVVSFGQIRPGKGIEAFLDLAQLSAGRSSPLRFEVIGAALPRHAAYLQQLRRTASENVDWTLNGSLQSAAERMAKSLAAYLPFPDGASYRRGSLIGALINGLPIISKVSAVTPPELSELVLHADNAEQALAHADNLLHSPQLAAAIGASCRSRADRFCWSSIAEAHQEIYASLRNQDALVHSAAPSKEPELRPK